jgi:hypothetical protein
MQGACMLLSHAAEFDGDTRCTVQVRRCIAAMKLPFGKKAKNDEGAGDEESGEGGGDQKVGSALGAYDVTEHLMEPQEVADKLQTSINIETPHKSTGLTKDEVRAARVPTSCKGARGHVHSVSKIFSAERCKVDLAAAY